MIVRIIKVQELPNAEVPNNIEVGATRIGRMYEKPKIGERFFIQTKGLTGFQTSEIRDIIEIAAVGQVPKGGWIIKTLNSVYKIEIL
jgi:hypothetical protein